MKKLMLTACVVLAFTASAFAQPNHTMGDNFTQALNAIEACGKLDTLAPTKKTVHISSIRMRGQQVVVSLRNETPSPIVFDIGAERVVTEGVCP